MAVHNNTGSALSPGWSGLALGGSALSLHKLGLTLGKVHTAHATTSILLSLSRGVGFSIRERLIYLGGGLKVESELGHGTRGTLVAPLKAENESAGED